MIETRMQRKTTTTLREIMAADREGLVVCQHGSQWLSWGSEVRGRDLIIAEPSNFSSQAGERYVSYQGRPEEGVSYEGREGETWTASYLETVVGQ